MEISRPGTTTRPRKTKDHGEALILADLSRKIFVEALTNPPKPNEAAIVAAKRFKQEVEAQPSSGPRPSRLPIRPHPEGRQIIAQVSPPC
jgi:hypothetical protein